MFTLLTLIGINIAQSDFEGRARWGATFGGFAEEDFQGHGTHVGTIAGKRFSVAKNAEVIAVRVVNDAGSAVVSDAIAAVNWIIEEVTTHMPSMINMSLCMFPLARCTALALAWLSAAQASSDLLPIAVAHLPGRPGWYIVTLKDASVERRDFSLVHRSILSSLSADDSRMRYEWPHLNALAGTFSDAALTMLRSSGDVAAIERDVHGGVAELIMQTDAPWGLQRISQVPRMSSNDDHGLNYTYVYDSSAGKGLDIYIVDSGVNVEHDNFECRAC
ncbi:hypothetical protein AURDEDRAFT_178509 [Auricularia subglabra TFB-10046 SS5]|uniref:Peptidase S8/S53 domain-containing protein n=1 Tax=Auricularia subglabra (strain TFB-10046 / SS5) TaxID=717982 RepID=J0D1G8_AURST|nr:hypothetical protein AURDEDRAFT_178509 [Auricularia subglabra TFB-10046 SS5]